jgi:predicted alpha/beta-hydrolase family hydrolase
MPKTTKSFTTLVSESKPFTHGSVYGYLHSPGAGKPCGGVVLTHGAGANCETPLLVGVASALAAAGYYVLRCDLAFRQRKRSGPPHPSHAGEDRESLRAAAAAMRSMVDGKLILGGHSYGGRQATILASENASVADSLLLLSYPLHPPAKPDALRTQHFANVGVPSLFVQGTKDDFGTVAEMTTALKLINAPTRLSVVEGARHDLAGGRFDVQELVVGKLFL